MDFLAVGNSAVFARVSTRAELARAAAWTFEEQRSQIAVWAMQASPMFLSTDITQLSPGAVAALTNPRMISILQSGMQTPTQIANGTVWALVKPGPGGGKAVLLFNTGTGSAAGYFSLARLGISATSAQVRDMWTGAAQTITRLAYALRPGGTAFYEVR
jgi:hypothetical protein